MAELFYQGHGSFRITSDGGKVIYVDPYAGKGYDRKADLVLITHEHADHNKLSLIRNRTEDTVVFRAKDAIVSGGYRNLDLGWVSVEPVRAENRNHDPAECVGFIIRLDGKTVYASGDTSMFGGMKELAEYGIDLALFPTDGRYNMGPEEAAECAELVKAKRAVPIHTDPYSIFDIRVAERFSYKDRVIVRPGETIRI